MTTRMNTYGFLAALAVGCGLPATPSDVKMAGVGLDPDEIGAFPDMHGGLIEYNLFDFAGSQLPLGLLGLVSYDGVGADVGFSPPYKMVFGQGFIFQDDLGNPDALFGSLSKPPDAVGVCQTRYEPRSYLSGLADVGNRITFSTPGGDGGWSIGRRPYVYPPDVRDVFTYYLELDAWRAQPRVRPVQIDATNSIPTSLDDQVLVPANFPEGELIEVNFPGGIPPMEASIGSIPVPLASTGESHEIVLPHSPQGVRLGWNGPRYDSLGRLVDAASSSEGGEGDDTGAVPVEGNSACLQYLAHNSAPVTAEDCASLEEAPRTPDEFEAIGGDFESRSLPGQMYTGPWDTDDQQVVFEWIPGAEANAEIVTLTVRFLGAVDREDENLVEGVVQASAAAPNADSSWASAQDAGRIPDSASLPVGRREAASCDVPYEMENPALIRDQEVTIDWPLDDAHTYSDDTFIPSLHGDPGHTVAEMTCRLDDQKGRFVLSQSVMDKAMDYAAAHGAEGAVFFFSRSTESALQTPPVRDRYGNRHDISAVKMIGRSVQIGRFWYGQ